MKIALCLNGQPRNWEAGFNSLNKQLISKYDVDIFGHVWWDKSEIGKIYKSCQQDNHKDYIVEDDILEKLTEKYKFKQIHAESDPGFKNENIANIDAYSAELFPRLKSKYFSVKQSLNYAETHEKETRIEYDWVVLTRFDINLMVFPDTMEDYSKDSIYVDALHSAKYVFNDNLWIFGKNRKSTFKNIFDEFDKTYNLLQNLKQTPQASHIINTGLSAAKITCGEHASAFYLLFNNFIDDVKKLPELSYNICR